jgi:hypothetical protein
MLGSRRALAVAQARQAQGSTAKPDVIARGCRFNATRLHARRSSRYSPWLTSASTCLSNNAHDSILTSPAPLASLPASFALHCCHPATASSPSPPRRRVSTARSLHTAPCPRLAQAGTDPPAGLIIANGRADDRISSCPTSMPARRQNGRD